MSGNTARETHMKSEIMTNILTRPDACVNLGWMTPPLLLVFTVKKNERDKQGSNYSCKLSSKNAALSKYKSCN